jgi:3-methyladenine DNA glycosylase AlkD
VDVAAAAAGIDEGLRSAGTQKRSEAEKRYLKSDLIHYGTTVPEIRKIVKAWTKAQSPLAHADVVRVVEELWNQPVHERRSAAVEVLSVKRDTLRADDIMLVERLIREAKTWALVDPLAALVVPAVLERHPEVDGLLDRWATDDDFWIRRSALLAHLKALAAGEGDFERFGRLADAMLDEKEFFIRKAIGWVLRDVSRKRPQLVYEWIAPRTHRASGVTIREAVKRLPENQAEQIRSAYKSKRPVNPADLIG